MKHTEVYKKVQEIWNYHMKAMEWGKFKAHTWDKAADRVKDEGRWRNQGHAATLDAYQPWLQSLKENNLKRPGMNILWQHILPADMWSQ